MWYRKLIVSLGLSAIVGLCSGFNTAAAHDIDIYLNNSTTSTNSEPLLMFTLDMRPSLYNSGCAGYDVNDDTTRCWTLVDGGWLLDVQGNAILPANATSLDVYRNTLIKVLKEQIIDAQGKPIKVGLIVPHVQSNCAGIQTPNTRDPSALNENSADAPAVAERCSNGGYVRFGFKLIDDTATGIANFAEFTQMLRSIPNGDRTPKYQGAEMMFEFYRYLQGYQVWNGFNGWDDLNRANNDDGTNRNLADPADSINSPETIDGSGNLTGPTATVGGVAGTVVGMREMAWPLAPLVESGANVLDVNNNIVYTDTPDPDVFEDKASGPNNWNWYYKSPILSGCAKIYSLNFIFGVTQQDSESDSEIEKDDNSSDMGMGISNLPNQNNERFKAVLARLYGMDLSGAGYQQNVTSYIFTPGPTFQQHEMQQAGSGGGIQTAFDITDPSDFEAQFEDILSSILSVSTTFVAPSIAVNVYNRSQVENDLFIAMFNAPTSAIPLWPGNVKKVNLNEDSNGAVTLVDVNGDNAVDPNQGRISKDALTFWTIQADLPAPADADEDEYAIGKDGRRVDRGGSGSKIPGYKLDCDENDYTDDQYCGTGISGGFETTPTDYPVGLTNPGGSTTATSRRRVFTEPETYTNGTATDPFALEATTTGVTELETQLLATSSGVFSGGDCDPGDTDITSACNLIKYLRGVKDTAAAGDTDGTNNRDWLMGDALHSRPLTMNYGAANGYSSTVPDIRIIVGTNDGFLRMIRNKTTGGAESGVETWAYMPREVMGIVKDLKKNITSNEQHPYGVDGEPVTYVIDNDADGNIESGDGDKVYLYFGLRRGGNAYTALDITDPDDPQFLWKIAKTTGGDFDELGQTWSTPRVKSMVFDGNTAPRAVLIFGGGYDANKDDHDTSSTGGHTAAAGGSDSEGNAIFIVDALTGTLVWKAIYDASASTPSYDSVAKAYKRDDMLDSIPSAITAVDPNGNDLPDRLYVGDTGGVVWRVDMLSNDQADWVVNPILSVGRRMTNTTPDLPKEDRRFYYPPDYVQAKDSTTGESFDAVVIGTGKRTEPLAFNTENWFYVLRDRDLVSNTLVYFSADGMKEHHDQWPDVTDTTTNKGLVDVSTDSCYILGNCANDPVFTHGWKMRLDCPNDSGRDFAGGDCGEKNLSAAFTIGGTIFMTSYIPPDPNGTVCGPKEGGGILYELSLQDGSATKDNDGDGVIDVNDRYTNLRSGGIPAEVVSLGGDKVLAPDLTIKEPKVKGGFRTYWHDAGIE